MKSIAGEVNGSGNNHAISQTLNLILQVLVTV